MKTIAFAALFVGVASGGLLACGGDDGGDITFGDASPRDSGTGASCNPVTQQGCADGEKCSWLVVQEDPFLGRTDCVPDGTVEVGGECTEGTPGEATGYDDCAAGLVCMGGLCRTICSIEPDSCAEGFACSLYTQTFEDDPDNNLGVCDTTCDPVAQDCADDTQGCYLKLYNGKATCAPVAMGAETQTQGEECVNDGSRCFANGCAEGYTGLLDNGTGTGPALCTAYCTPVETYLIDPDGNGRGTGPGVNGTNQGSDANGAAPHDCAAGTIGPAGHQCRFFQSVLTMQGYLDYISDAYGFCVPKGVDYGDCTKWSEEWLLAQYDAWVGPPGNNDPSTWPDRRDMLCDGSTQCAFACAKLETIDALDTAYCDANPDSVVCAGGARGIKLVHRIEEMRYMEALLKAGLAPTK